MTKKDYKKIIEYLYDNKDLTYKEFHCSLKGANEMIGVRTNILKNIAKEVSKSKYLDFINLNEKYYYEEKAILAYLFGYLKCDFNTIIGLVEANLQYFDTWALTDGFCTNFKIIKKYPKEGLVFINKLLISNNPWYIRIGLVLLLSHYVSDTYIDKLLEISLNIKSDNYYVIMANAWLISICYIKYPSKTKLILDKLDGETRKKAISKINDSKRVKDKLKNTKVSL